MQGQPSGSQPRPQPRPLHLFRPENMRGLPDQFAPEEKAKWEAGLRQLWSQIENNPEDHPSHIDAKRKLAEFSKGLTLKVQTFRTQQKALQAQQAAQQAANANANNQAQQNQNKPQAEQRPQQPQQQASQQPQQPQEGQNNGGNPSNNPQQQARPPVNKPQIPERILTHVNQFPWVLPPSITSGSPEAIKWLTDIKSRYAKGLIAMENANRAIKMNEEWIKKIREERNATEQEEKEFMTKDAEAKKQHGTARKFVEELRDQQRRVQSSAKAAGAPTANGNNGGAAPPGTAAAAGGNGQDNASNGGNPNPAAQRPQMNSQQPSNPALQNTQTVNAAIEQARNQQQMGGVRPPMPQNGQMSQTQTSQLQAPNAPSQSNVSQSGGGPAQNIKAETGPPTQINTAVTQMQNQARPGQTNSPQSAVPQSATSVNVPNLNEPKALTHQAALQTAAQNYNSGQISSTPTIMGHSHTHPNAVQRDPINVNSQKLPIPKHLPERATAPPQPVQMSQSRPTFSGGPSGSGSGVMGQPVLAKPPGYVLDGEGDRVLSRKKLDELVKQVTGGGESISGGGLTAEVEESVLTVADNFVDQVLQAACKNAKERGSNILEIRDIQLTLERGYNIRIPGYASDEIRTVRKIAPSSGWINKMSAVQAAKVTGGKSTD
ncbi:transcription initiation factor tfiid subunit 12 protein [Rutstroemia sp. NJR-2017a BVV2]|nr:transcription initiation factor tfiid subunit 12 protein [Rutstroemia sp. NJR-2017a BVV2]